jgi:hypothetical protein
MFRRFDARRIHPVPVLALLAIFSHGAAGAQAPALPPARDLVARHVAASGGEAAQKKVSSILMTGEFSIPAQNIAGDLRLSWARPALRRLLVEIPGVGRIETGYDGKVGWTIDPLQGPALLTGRKLRELADDAWFDATLHAPGYVRDITTVAREEFDGRQAYKVRVVLTSGSEQFEYFDVATGLQIGVEASRETVLGVVNSVSVMRDYKTFGALAFPTTIVQRTIGIEQVLHITSVAYDGVPAGVFELPPQIKALLK